MTSLEKHLKTFFFHEFFKRERERRMNEKKKLEKWEFMVW